MIKFGSDGTGKVRKQGAKKLRDPHGHRAEPSLRVGKETLGDLRTSESSNSSAGKGRGKKG